MRKLFLIMLLLLVALGAGAEVVGFEGEMEAGYADGLFGSWTEDEIGDSFDEWDFTSFETTYLRVGGYVWLFEHFYVGGDATVQMELSRWILETGMSSVHDLLPNYKPTFTNYRFEAGISLFDSMSLFISHDCVHPQNTNQYAYKVTSVWGEGAITRVGVRFRAETDGVGWR